MTVLLLGDQLSRRQGPLADPERVVGIEARSFARRRPYHPHKLALVFSAMRHARDDLREDGVTVDYYQVDTFREGLRAHFETHPDDELTVVRPTSHGAVDRLRDLVADVGGTLTVVPDETFLCDWETFDDWAVDTDRLRHESFYRFMRRQTGYLMDGEEPVGGEWNYDDQNRETPPDDYDPPEPPRFEPDATTREVIEWVENEFGQDGYDEPPYGTGWADPEPFRWPVTREQALETLESFATERLDAFGPYQDAMLDSSWAMHHSLLSVALNLGLLSPAEVIERVITAYERRDLPLNSVEGFVRQVLGWREFLRHVYRREMPDLATANQLGARQDLPEWYWTGDTDMTCLADVLDGVRKRGYSHHIERLMLLSNFALLYGVEPAQLNEWFHAGYVDAYHWVTTPNVIEMGLYGAGVFATKPYAASANYIDRMSTYCGDCPYDETATTGEDACPFNALYWNFLDRNEDDLRENHRMGLVYSHLDDRDETERQRIRERADQIRRMAEDGRL